MRMIVLFVAFLFDLGCRSLTQAIPFIRIRANRRLNLLATHHPRTLSVCIVTTCKGQWMTPPRTAIIKKKKEEEEEKEEKKRLLKKTTPWIHHPTIVVLVLLFSILARDVKENVQVCRAFHLLICSYRLIHSKIPIRFCLHVLTLIWNEFLNWNENDSNPNLKGDERINYPFVFRRKIHGRPTIESGRVHRRRVIVRHPQQQTRTVGGVRGGIRGGCRRQTWTTATLSATIQFLLVNYLRVVPTIKWSSPSIWYPLSGRGGEERREREQGGLNLDHRSVL